MIISHRQQPNGAPGFAVFRQTKTGGHSLMIMLRLTGAFDERDIMTPVEVFGLKAVNMPPTEHWQFDTPADAVANGTITEQQLIDYNCVAVLRDPMDRYRSAHTHHDWFSGAIQSEIKRHRDMGLLTKSTESYFKINGVQVCDPIMFNDLDSEIRRVCLEVGGPSFPVILRVNTTLDRSGVDIADFLDAPSRAAVAAAIKPDIDFFDSLVDSQGRRR